MQGVDFLRVGIGYDVHKLVEGRKLILGGVFIPYEYGLLGHSDADVLVHAIIDAMLGSCALGDIGKHFPDTSDQYKDISSILLLKEANKLLNQKGYVINNVDSIVVAQMPKIAPYIEQMRQVIAEALETDIDNISVKATTTEGLGFEGLKEGISAKSIVSVKKP